MLPSVRTIKRVRSILFSQNWLFPFVNFRPDLLIAPRRASTWSNDLSGKKLEVLQRGATPRERLRRGVDSAGYKVVVRSDRPRFEHLPQSNPLKAFWIESSPEKKETLAEERT